MKFDGKGRGRNWRRHTKDKRVASDAIGVIAMDGCFFFYRFAEPIQGNLFRDCVHCRLVKKPHLFGYDDMLGVPILIEAVVVHCVGFV